MPTSSSGTTPRTAGLLRRWPGAGADAQRQRHVDDRAPAAVGQRTEPAHHGTRHRLHGLRWRQPRLRLEPGGPHLARRPDRARRPSGSSGDQDVAVSRLVGRRHPPLHLRRTASPRLPTITAARWHGLGQAIVSWTPPAYVGRGADRVVPDHPLRRQGRRTVPSDGTQRRRSTGSTPRRPLTVSVAAVNERRAGRAGRRRCAIYPTPRPRPASTTRPRRARYFTVTGKVVRRGTRAPVVAAMPVSPPAPARGRRPPGAAREHRHDDARRGRRRGRCKQYAKDVLPGASRRA